MCRLLAPRRLGLVAAFALVLAPTRPATADEAPAWAGVEEPERRLVTGLLESPHWPIRAFALLRLERYAGPEREPLVRARLADEAWQARCFAIRAARRMGLEVAAADLEPERDGRVIRAALRYGVTVDPERLERGTRRLLRARELDELLLGLEIAAACDVEPLRRDAAGRLQRLCHNMDESLLIRVSRRLTRVVGLDEEPPSVEAWQAWGREHGGHIPLAPARPPGAGPSGGPLPLVAEMDFTTFSRLLDYLGALRHRDLEVAIVMDATMSMMPMINEARAGVESLILFLDDVSRDTRVALVAYRDHDNEPVWEGEPLTSDVGAIRRFLFGLKITGGADLPEAVLEGLTACGRLAWSREAARQIILVGDARPHEEDEYRLTGLLESIRGAGITVHAAHVPMRLEEAGLSRLPPAVRDAREREVAEHNALTERAFAEIARLGGGDKVTLLDAEELVPAIMHLTIDEPWWPAFDEFYALYLELCR